MAPSSWHRWLPVLCPHPYISRGHHCSSLGGGAHPHPLQAAESSCALRTSNHENFDFRVWGHLPGAQISSEIRHSLQGPACSGVPGPSLQEEVPVSKHRGQSPSQGQAVLPPQLPGHSLELGASIPKRYYSSNGTWNGKCPLGLWTFWKHRWGRGVGGGCPADRSCCRGKVSELGQAAFITGVAGTCAVPPLGEQVPCPGSTRGNAAAWGWHEEPARGPRGQPSSCRAHAVAGASPEVPGREPEESSCRLSRTPSSYKASFCTIFCRAGLMTICGGCDGAELPRSDPGVGRALS